MDTPTNHQLLIEVRRKAAESGRQLAGHLTLSGACMALGLCDQPPKPPAAADMLTRWLKQPRPAAATNSAGRMDTLALREMRERLRPDFRNQAEGGTWARIGARTNAQTG